MTRYALIVLAAGCVQTDLNHPCILVRANPDGGKAVQLLNGDDIIKNSANKDFISFGSTECEDQVCVRDSAYCEVPDGGGACRQTGLDPAAPAYGYCSRACGIGTSCPSENGADDNDPKRSLSCRPLLLDQDTLKKIMMADPDRYKMLFGMTTTPYFCARGGGDGGV